MILIITAIIFLLGVSLGTYFLGLPPSISDFFYRLPYGLKWLFTVFLSAIGILCMYIGLNNTMVLMGFSCILVGFFPRFNEDQKLQHYISAVGIIGAGMWQIGVVLGSWYLPVIFIVLLYPLYRLKNHILWIELVAFGMIIFGLTIN